MKIVLLSNHYYNSTRRAGFHHIADALAELGHEVVFITTGLSIFSYLRRDFRTKYKGIIKSHNKVIEQPNCLKSFTLFTLFHPHNLLIGFFNNLTSPYFKKYGAIATKKIRNLIQSSDCVIFESSSSLYLFDEIKKLLPEAKLIYRVSDDIRMQKSRHPNLDQVEESISPLFDLISVPSSYLFTKFSQFKTKLQFHGIDKQLFDSCASPSEYTGREKNFVFVGNAYFDSHFLEIAARSFPQFTFHVIGPINNIKTELANVLCYGEMSYRTTIPYIKHADVGMFPLQQLNTHARSFTDSLKIIQYKYSKLPIIVPSFLNKKEQGFFSYSLEDEESVRTCVLNASQLGKVEWGHEGINSWRELALELIDI